MNNKLLPFATSMVLAAALVTPAFAKGRPVPAHPNKDNETHEQLNASTTPKEMDK